MRHWIVPTLLLLLGGITGTALGQSGDGLLDTTEPMRWRGALMPEEGEDLSLPEYFGPADRARAYLNAGRYKRAIYELAASDEGEAPERALVLAEASLRLGRLDEAEQALADTNDARAAVLRARVAQARGDLPEAARRLDEQLAREPADVHARLLRGQIAESAGDMETARAHYKWFADEGLLQRWVSDPDGRRFEAAEDVVAIATALDRYATIEGEYKKDPTLHDAVLGMFVRAYDVIDRDYWPAHLAAARFAYERGDRILVEEALQAALARNEHDAAALTLLGEIRLDRYDFARAAAVATSLRTVDPNSRAADLLDARNLLLQRQPLKAEPYAQRLLARRPDDLEALALQAAVYAVRLDEPNLTATLAKIEQIDPDHAAAFFVVGRQLSGLRQYPRAEEMLRTAVERAPWWTAPRNALGLLLTQSGDEQGAIRELTAAREYDPFNIDSSNYRKLLTELSNYNRLETQHFLIQSDNAQDPLSAELFAEYLDDMKEDVARIYRWSPEDRTRIQIFPTHDRFSVRVAGDPYVGTVAACTGPVIAMVTPRDGPETLGAYHFAKVVRHEFAHTITLGRTNNRIPHWMTEGLAVREEQSPIRQEWLDLLSAAYNETALFGVGELTWGFVRPRKPTDRSLAYAQSWLVCEYLIEQYGEEKLHGLLDEFAKGRSEAEAFRDVLGVELTDFDKQFVDRMAEQMRDWGRLPEQAEGYELMVREAEMALQRRDFAVAVKRYESARTIRPMDELPMRRLAGLYLAGESLDPTKALDVLLALHERTTNDNRFAKRAARLLLDREEAPRAQTLAYDAVQIAPYDTAAHQLLLEAATAAGDADTIAKQQRRLATLAALAGGR